MTPLAGGGFISECLLCGRVHVVISERQRLAWDQHMALCEGPGVIPAPPALEASRRRFVRESLDKLSRAAGLIDAAERMRVDGSSVAGEAETYLRENGGSR